MPLSQQCTLILALSSFIFASGHSTEVVQPPALPVSHVFTMTNSASGNSVLVYTRAANGSLTLAQTAPTGGKGSGAHLMSQGALATASHFLFVVNAGSNTISVLTIGNTHLTLVSTVSSGGIYPLSLTYFEGKLYVLNQDNGGTISGFTFDSVAGVLTPIPGSTQPLSGSADPEPAQISFMKNGAALIVTEKQSNLLDVYPVTPAGVAGPPASYSANAPTPYGFVTGTRNRFYVTEANQLAPFASSVSSYTLSASNVPQIISGSVSTAQSQACWIALSASNTFAYVTDNASDVISVYSIDASGRLSLIPAFNVKTTSLGAPIDDALSTDGKFLYVLYGRTNGVIGVYTVNADGSLTQSSTAPGVVQASAGILVK